MLSFCTNNRLCRSFLLLAPKGVDASQFRSVERDSSRYRSLLERTQRLRGGVYAEMDALTPDQLTGDGRHCHASDEGAFHLITLDRNEDVAACARYMLYPEDVCFDDLNVSRTSMAANPETGPRLREAVESEMDLARRRGLRYVEVGGWAIAQDLRCTTEAVRMILSLYALSERFGGVLGITTANRTCSAPILRRTGGEPLSARGEKLPGYFDPHYHHDLEILRFDSTRPSSKFEQMLDRLRSRVIEIPVLAAS